MLRLPAILCAAMSVAGLGVCALGEDERPYRGKVFLGLGTRAVALPKDVRYKSTHGLLVTRVSADSSAENAGMRVGDVILSIDGQEWTTDKIRLSRSFGKAGEKSRPGDVAHMRILRSTPGAPNAPREIIPVDVTLAMYPGTRPDSPPAPTNLALRPDVNSVRPPYEDLCWKLIDARGLRADCEDLLLRLARCEEFPDPHRMGIVRYVHRDPFKLQPVAHEILDPIARTSSRGVRDAPFFLDRVTHVLTGFDGRRSAAGQERAAGIPALPAFPGKDLSGHAAYVEAVLRQAALLQSRAFDSLTREEVAHVLQSRSGLLDSYIECRMLSYDTDAARQKASVRLLKIAAKVDVRALLRQARLAARLVSPEFTASLVAAAAASGKNLDAGVILERKTPYGAILISGRARRRYQGKDYAAIYDLGGDDVYANNVASSVWGRIPTAVIVDYAGNDAYESHRPFSQGCGDLGVGILADLGGDDSYVGTRYAQGVGFMGIGMLFDEAGDDVYRGLQFNQAVAQWGVGLLVDRAGRDRYESHDTSQGVGLPGGCGMLYDGGSRGDEYYCKGKQPTGYGNPGVFEGWGQAMGVGYRPYASGGVGILFDEGGRDRMEAGNFCQGGGYFYAFGLLYNRGSDADVYIGSRYAQGFGCHQAAGAFIEAGGDDHYTTRRAVAQGLAWDEAVALFVDEGGNDRYEGGGFSQGASAQNGWTLFIERGGKDTYLYAGQARAGSNKYHGGTSLSFFLDLGGDEDDYPKKPNNRILAGPEHFIFVDLPGSIAQALRADAWKELMAEPASKKE